MWWFGKQVGRWSAVVMLFFVLFSPTPTEAAGIKYEAQFVDHPWEVTWNGQFGAPDRPCRGPDGESSWEFTNTTASIDIRGSVSCKTVIQPIDFDWEWPRVVEVSFDFTLTTLNMDRNLLLRWQDPDNYIGFHIFGTHIEAEKLVDGVGYAFPPQSTSFGFTPYQTYAMRMQHDSSQGTLRLWINDQLIFSGQEDPDDPILSVGNPALGASVGLVPNAQVSFSNYTWQDVSATTQIEVPLLKQTDERWQQEIYDSASEWTHESPTLARWGCALTSAVMVFRSHGITSLPDGQELWPSTLNTWLIAQPDGYVFPGLVNWRALTRLSHWHQTAYGTPVLEMSFFQLPEINVETVVDWVQDQIELGIVPILDEKGHFVVANSVGPGAVDIGIHDPLYDHTLLAAYDNTFYSARLFTPSFTDLSALTIYTSPGTKVWVTNSTGQRTLLDPLPAFAATTTPGMPTHEASTWIYDLPKPQEAELTISTLLPGNAVQIFAYDVVGELILQKSALVTPQSLVTVQIENTGGLQVSLDTSENLPRLSAADFAQWLSWQRVHSPGVAHALFALSEDIWKADTLEMAQQVQVRWEEMSVAWWQNGWLETELFSFLNQYFWQVALQRFP